MITPEALRYFNENAETLSAQYNALDRKSVHVELLALLPTGKNLKILDVGAGSGVDAALFADLGHDVTAVEPAGNLRAIAQKTFQNPNIHWTADALPELAGIKGLYDVIYAVGTLQYLEAPARAAALDAMAELLTQDGLLEIQYPTPPSRGHQFHVKEGEISALCDRFNAKAGKGALEIICQKRTPDLKGRKALNGEDLYFNIAVLRRKTPGNSG